jgi:hypothetical protein
MHLAYLGRPCVPRVYLKHENEEETKRMNRWVGIDTKRGIEVE